jgi:hypothetical protein
MLFPSEPVRACTERDAWLIDRYRPSNDLKHQPASLLPGGITYISHYPGKTSAPNALIAEVDQAYFRLSLMERINQWFEERGFDLEQPTFSKQDFEAALAKPSVTARPVGKLKGDEIPGFVKNYLDSEPKPTLTGIRKKWSDAGHGAQARNLLDAEYRKEAILRNISLKRGPKRILQK